MDNFTTNAPEKISAREKRHDAIDAIRLRVKSPTAQKILREVLESFYEEIQPSVYTFDLMVKAFAAETKRQEGGEK